MDIVKLLNNGSSFLQNRKLLFNKYKIGTSYDDSRIIFYNNKRNDLKKINSECNGLILDRNTLKPLVIPSSAKQLYHLNKTHLDINNYDVYKAFDGTLFNMYFYENAWCISTTKGFQMNNIKPGVDKTYQDIITECLNEYNLTWVEFISKLNTQYCYSFGFSHSEIQLLSRNNKLWFVQSCNLSTLQIEYNNPVSNIPIQNKIHNIDIPKIINTAKNALVNYNNEDPLYGYILKAKNNTQDIFVQSSLMTKLKKMIYSHKIHKTCIGNKYNKKKYVMLNAYLNSQYYEWYSVLSGQNIFNDISEKINQVINYMRNPNIQTTEDVMNAGNYLLNDLTTQYGEDILNNNDPSFLNLFVINNNNIHVLYKLC